MDEQDITARKYFQLWPFAVSASEGTLQQIINTNPATETWHLTNQKKAMTQHICYPNNIFFLLLYILAGSCLCPKHLANPVC